MPRLNPNRIVVHVRDRYGGQPVPGMRVWWGERQGHRVLNCATMQAIFHGLPPGELQFSAGPNVTQPWVSDMVAVPAYGEADVELLVDCKFTEVNTTAIPCRDGSRLTEASKAVLPSSNVVFSVDLIRDLLYEKSGKQRLLYTMIIDKQYNNKKQAMKSLVTGAGDQAKHVYYTELHPFNQAGYKYASPMKVSRKWGTYSNVSLACGDECSRIARDVLQCPVLENGALAEKTYHLDSNLTVDTFRYKEKFLKEVPDLLALQLQKGNSVRLPLIYGAAVSDKNGLFDIGADGSHFILVIGCSPDHRTFLYIDPLARFSLYKYPPLSLVDVVRTLVKPNTESVFNNFLGTFTFEADTVYFKDTVNQYRILGVPAAAYT